jgi:hypothetical protein
MVAGQNLRYIGRPFPGYKAEEPYMTFIKDHNVYEITVLYNNAELVINRTSVKVVM